MAYKSSPTSNLVIAGSLLVIGIVILAFSHPLTRLAFIPCSVVAFMFFVSRRHYLESPPKGFLLLYLICIGIQCLHFIEEYVWGFHERVAEVLPFSPMSAGYFIRFNLIAYGCFLVAAFAIHHGIKWAMVVAWFFIIAGVAGNMFWHPLLALRAGGYFPGLYTSLLYWIVAPFLFRLAFRGYPKPSAIIQEI
jgi:hypothetical protein